MDSAGDTIACQIADSIAERGQNDTRSESSGKLRPELFPKVHSLAKKFFFFFPEKRHEFVEVGLDLR